MISAAAPASYCVCLCGTLLTHKFIVMLSQPKQIPAEMEIQQKLHHQSIAKLWKSISLLTFFVIFIIVAGEREVWGSLVDLLPPQPDLG